MARNSYQSKPKCHTTHEPLSIDINDTTYKVHGGSCTQLLSDDYDVIVGLDGGMKTTDKMYPWSDGVQFLYPIKDMAAPSNPAEFKNLIQWLGEQVVADKRVFIGCIGGHGRTGTVLAALVYHLTGNADAIKYVRENYCDRAVESEKQINFLAKHFGMNKAKPSKAHSPIGKSSMSFGGSLLWDDIAKGDASNPATTNAGKKATYTPVQGPLSIHGD